MMCSYANGSDLTLLQSTFDPVRTENEPEPVELHLPTADALSPVWKYFGYRKTADGSLACDGYPLCRLCQMKVMAKGGSTTNMLMHLRAYHLDVYKEVKVKFSSGLVNLLPQLILMNTHTHVTNVHAHTPSRRNNHIGTNAVYLLFKDKTFTADLHSHIRMALWGRRYALVWLGQIIQH